MRNISLGILLATFFVVGPVSGETIDDMWCQKADGFGIRMESQGYKRELTLPFGWGGYDSSVSHNIQGSRVNSYDKKSKNRWALYTKPNGQWKLFQGVTRTNLNGGSTSSFVCEVKSGSGLVRH